MRMPNHRCSASAMSHELRPHAFAGCACSFSAAAEAAALDDGNDNDVMLPSHPPIEVDEVLIEGNGDYVLPPSPPPVVGATTTQSPVRMSSIRNKVQPQLERIYTFDIMKEGAHVCMWPMWPLGEPFVHAQASSHRARDESS